LAAAKFSQIRQRGRIFSFSAADSLPNFYQRIFGLTFSWQRQPNFRRLTGLAVRSPNRNYGSVLMEWGFLQARCLHDGWVRCV